MWWQNSKQNPTEQQQKLVRKQKIVLFSEGKKGKYMTLFGTVACSLLAAVAKRLLLLLLSRQAIVPGSAPNTGHTQTCHGEEGCTLKGNCSQGALPAWGRHKPARAAVQSFQTQTLCCERSYFFLFCEHPEEKISSFEKKKKKHQTFV